MALTELRLEDLRCLPSAHLALHPRLNLITGPNGSGKTTLLEGIYLLGRGRSFRTRLTEQLIRHGTAGWRVSGQVQHGPQGIVHQITIGCTRAQGVQARVDQRLAASLAELSEQFPVQAIDPGIHRLIEEGPVQRRRWLDWAVFHVEQDFVRHWQGYARALRQRNAALRSGADATLWDGELVRLGLALSTSRSRLLDALQRDWVAALADLDAPAAELGYFQGWSRDQSLAEALAAHFLRDRERGSTGSGPHRFDVLLRVNGHAARGLVSRGQQKLLAAAMVLTMARFVSRAAARAPALLLDDPAAELDPPHTERLLGAVAALGGQLVVTALRPEHTPLGAPDRVFHVEHQEVKTAIM